MYEWVDLEAPAKAAAASEPVTIASVQLRHGPPKVSLSIAGGIAAEVGWPRYRVAWNRDLKSFRIKASSDGSFEGFHPPRGKGAGEGEGRVIIRVPMPSDLVHADGRHAAVFDLDRQGKTLTVRVPSRFWTKRP